MSEIEFVRVALEEARAAYDEGEYPVGAVIVRDGEIVSRGRNRARSLNDPSAHAEILAIREACAELSTLKLSDCTLVTTMYPCPMCEAVIREVALPKVVYGARPYHWVREVKFANAVFEPVGPVLNTECRKLFAAKLEAEGRHDILDHERT